MDEQQEAEPERRFVHRWLIRILPWVHVGITALFLWRWHHEIIVWLKEGLNGIWLMSVLTLFIGSRWMQPIFRRLALMAVVALLCAGLIYADWQDMVSGLPILTKSPYAVYVMAVTFGVCLFLKQGGRRFYVVLSCGIGLALLLEFAAYVNAIGISGLIAILRYLFIENPLTTFVVSFLPLLLVVWWLSQRISRHGRGPDSDA